MEGVRRGDIGGPVKQQRAAIERLSKKKTKLFKGNNDESSEEAEGWLNDMSRVCDEIYCTPEEKLECLVSLLRSDAINWWESIALTVPEEEKTLDFFCEEFHKNYVGEDFLEQKRMDFIHLKQKGDSVMGYKLKFVQLSRYGPELLPTPKDWCRKFVNGLHLELQNALITLETEDFNKVVSVAVRAEQIQSRMKGSGKRPQEQRGEYVASGSVQKKKAKSVSGGSQGGFSGGRNRGRLLAQLVASAPSVARSNNTYPPCATCGRPHTGECRMLSASEGEFQSTDNRNSIGSERSQIGSKSDRWS